MARDLVLVVHRAGTTGVRLWAGLITDGATPGARALLLRPGERRVTLPAAGWRRAADRDLPHLGRQVFVQVVSIDGLDAGAAYTLQDLGQDLGPAAGPGAAPGPIRCRFRALPADLPAAGDRPFTVLLGSCFAHFQDGEGRVGRALRLLPEADQPDVKILCGDQVYLDMPTAEGFTDERRWLARQFVDSYERTFFQHDGFADLLARGATYFTPDDHEYWNNFPNRFALAQNTWTEAGRERWRDLARGLFGDFQSDEPRLVGRPRRFEVGPLSFFIADTRTGRDPDGRFVMEAADMAALRDWVRSLRGPGVLCVTQPLLEAGGSWFGRTFEDRNLPDYADYLPLCRAIHAAPHDLVVITGDVHFGRVATCELAGGARLVEVVSSPLSLCDPRVGGRTREPPARFPAESDGATPQRPTRTLYRTATENLATLQFCRRAGRVEMAVRYWFHRAAGGGALPSEALPPLPLR